MQVESFYLEDLKLKSLKTPTAIRYQKMMLHLKLHSRVQVIRNAESKQQDGTDLSFNCKNP